MPAFTFTTDNVTRKLTIPGHGFSMGDGPIAVFNTGGALPSGLLPVTDYWVIVVDANTIQLASSLANALAGAAIPFFDNGSGTQTLGIGLPYRRPRTYAQLSQLKSVDLNAIFDVLIALWAFLSGQLQTLWNGLKLAGTLIVGGQPLTFNNFTFTANAATDQLTAAAHGLSTGDGPVQVSSFGSFAGGLVAFTNYWVIVVDANTLKLATSFANALAGTAIDITSNGSGTQVVSQMPTTTRATDATVTRNLSVGGAVTAVSYKHGIKTLPIPPSAFVPIDNTIAYTLTSAGLSAAPVKAVAPILLPVGKRIRAVRLFVKDSATGPTTMRARFTEQPTGGAAVDLDVSSASNASGNDQTLTIPLFATSPDPIVLGKTYQLWVDNVAGTASVTVRGGEIDYDEP